MSPLYADFFCSELDMHGSLCVCNTIYDNTRDFYFAAHEHTLEITSWEEEAELKYVCYLKAAVAHGRI
jgi:hypothetical protein